MFHKGNGYFHYIAIAVLKNIFAINADHCRLSILNSGQKLLSSYILGLPEFALAQKMQTAFDFFFVLRMNQQLTRWTYADKINLRSIYGGCEINSSI